MDHLPLIDLRVSPEAVARAIGDACRAHGFFSVSYTHLTLPTILLV